MNKLTFFIASLLILSLNSCSMPGLSDKKVKKEYYRGGAIQSEFIMTDKTEMNGTLKQYGYTGNLKVISHIKNGVKHGEMIVYDDNSLKIEKRTYVNGRLHGTQESFYPNGDLMITYPYINGILHGEGKSYRIDGEVEKTVIFENGKLIR